MLPAAVCAGMTLPLITYALIRRRRSASAASAWSTAPNTVGAIVGVLFAVHVGMPLLGPEEPHRVPRRPLDIALGVLLLARCAERIGLPQASPRRGGGADRRDCALS